MSINHGMYLGFNAKPWQTIYQESATQQHPLGAFFDDEWGRRFRYAKNSSAGAQLAGALIQAAALGGATTTLQSVAAVSVAAAAGDTRIYLTAATTAQSANLYDEGWAAICDVSTGDVYTRRVKYSSALETTGTSGYIDIYDTVPVALTISDKVALQINPYKNVIVCPTTITGMVLGLSCTTVTASYYFWIQTRGIAGFKLKDVTTNITVGPATGGGSTAGTIVGCAEAGSGAYDYIIGNATALWLDEYSGFIWLACE